MSEKSDQSGHGPLQTQPDESNRAGGKSLQKQHDGAQKAATEADKIGPGHPPRNTQWKKGGPSPNPKGRPRKEQTMLPDLKKALEQAFNKKVPVSRGAKKALMTRIDIGFEQLLNQVAKGDRHAWRVLMDIAAKVGIDFQAKHKEALEETLAPNHQAILNAALARLSGASVASIPVLAPPELLDDDRVETAPPSRPELAAPSTRAPANIAPAPASARTPAKIEPVPPSGSEAKTATEPAAPPRRGEAAPTLPPPIKAQPARRLAPAPGEAQPAPTSPPPDPEPNPLAPKPFSRMRWTEKRAWYPEWWALQLKWNAEQGI